MTALVASNALALPLLSSPPLESQSYTHVNVVKMTYLWTIVNFSALMHEKSEALFSPAFPGLEDDTVQWQLQIFPRGSENALSDSVSLFLYLNSSTHEKAAAKFHLRIVDSENNTVHSSDQDDFHRFKVGEEWGTREFVNRSALLKSSKMLPNDTLRLLCDIYTIGDVTSIPGTRGNNSEIAEHPLAEDFGRLLESYEMADATLVARGEEFPAHRTILAARSSVFAATFADVQANPGERVERVELGDLDPVVVREMLRFVYTDSTPNLETLAKDLLSVADKFAIEGLKNRCERQLSKTVDAENAADLLILAESLNANRLRWKIVDFAIAHAKDVMDSASFKLMAVTHPQLAAEIIRSYLTRYRGQ